MTAAPFTAAVTMSDGTTETFPRYGDSARFVVVGRDAAGVRKGEGLAVAEWCATERGARNVRPEWQRYGGEWSIAPVSYTVDGRAW